MITERETMSLRKWYGTSMRIPKMGEVGFTDFAVSGLGIVQAIVREKFGKKISIRFKTKGTAHVDWEDMCISVNQNFLKGEVSLDIPVLTGDEALSNILGILVHEAAHFAFSPKDLEPHCEFIKKHTKCMYHEKVAATLSNIVEDIYIEAEVDREVPSLTWMLDCTNSIFFSSLSEEQTMESAKDVTRTPATLQEVAQALNVLIFAKTRERVNTTPYLSDLFNIARSGTEAVAWSDRYKLALELYDSLMVNITEEQCEDGSGSDEVEESARRGRGLTAPMDGSEDKIGPSVENLGIDPSKVERVLKSIEKKDVTVIQSVKENGTITSTLVMESVPESGSPLHADLRYAALAEVARQRSSVNRPYGLDRNKGHSIRKLHRIATDSKIFAEPVPMSNYQPMSVAILVDHSASMMTTGVTRSSRAEEAMAAALGAANALVEARCDVSVYAHTADILTTGDVAIYRCKGWKEPISVLPKRLGYLLSRIRPKENRDGCAIRYLGSKFAGGTKRKLLIVISDGQPAASEYYGPGANAHTKGEVDKLRRKGIDVLSISITREAGLVNNYIYGTKNNVCNEDVNVIADIVRSLIIS